MEPDGDMLQEFFVQNTLLAHWSILVFEFWKKKNRIARKNFFPQKIKNQYTPVCKHIFLKKKVLPHVSILFL